MTDSYTTFRWEQLARRQKIYIVAAVVLLTGLIVYGLVDRYRLHSEVRQFERDAKIAKGEAVVALEAAEKLARKVVEQEKQLAEKEAKRDGKVNEVEAAKVKVASDRLELNRVRRERRGDNPSPEQLCTELDALGYPCS
ncbi:MAG: hypothetical protein ABL959_09955 [Pyrinomonadaceae bacterium]